MGRGEEAGGPDGHQILSVALAWMEKWGGDEGREARRRQQYGGEAAVRGRGREVAEGEVRVFYGLGEEGGIGQVVPVEIWAAWLCCEPNKWISAKTNFNQN